MNAVAVIFPMSRPRTACGDIYRRAELARRRSGPRIGSAGDDVQRVRNLRAAIVLPRDVDLVVAPVGPDPPRAEEPAPEPEPALLDQLAAEDELALGDPVVAPELLAHAVDEHGERLAYPCRQWDPRLRHAEDVVRGGG